MPEGRVYFCSWKIVDDSVEVWVKRRPAVRAESEYFEDACADLKDEICDAYGDGEPCLEFDPPFSTPASETRVPPLVVVAGGNNRPDPFRGATAEMCRALYTGGLSTRCCGGLGERTKKPWFIGQIASGSEAAFTGYPVGERRLFSDQFLSMLTPGERRCAQWRPVIRSRGRKVFRELIGSKAIPLVAINGVKPTGWSCPTCGRRNFYPKIAGDLAVCEDDLPSPLPRVFPIGDARSTHLVMTLERWKKIVGRPGSRGCIGHPLILLPRQKAVREPKLPRRVEKARLAGGILPWVPPATT
jgi:hypothetical protein